MALLALVSLGSLAVLLAARIAGTGLVRWWETRE